MELFNCPSLWTNDRTLFLASVYECTYRTIPHCKMYSLAPDGSTVRSDNLFLTFFSLTVNNMSHQYSVVEKRRQPPGFQFEGRRRRRTYFAYHARAPPGRWGWLRCRMRATTIILVDAHLAHGRKKPTRAATRSRLANFRVSRLPTKPSQPGVWLLASVRQWCVFGGSRTPLLLFLCASARDKPAAFRNIAARARAPLPVLQD